MSQLDQMNKYLQEVKEKIEPSQYQKQDIKKRVDRVRQTLERDIPYVDGSKYSSKTYLHGSWKRRTQIRKSLDDRWDVDILAVIGGCVPSDHHLSGEPLSTPSSALRTIKKHLDNFFQNEIAQDKPCITIKYKSDNFDLEIMPIYFGNPEVYNYDYHIVMIPNYNLKSWNGHFPFRFGRILMQDNKKYKNFPITLIKLIKHWNNQNGKLMSGYDIELLTIFFFNELESIGNPPL
ncbi:MAG: hypothetical protein GF364_17120, partial [Candidatus Lokiarchaeota archaeon]|nr:hypothetical protein [Candidatus Lokiarchaeota archaeon]